MTYPYENLENFTLPALFNRSVQLYGQRAALGNVGSEAFTYQELEAKVLSMVTLLQNNGIKKGDKVVILSENMPYWAVAYFSITYFGGVVVPVLADFHPSDVHHILRHSEAKAVFVSEKHLSTIEEAEDNELKFVIQLDNLELVKSLSSESYFEKLKSKISKPQENPTVPDENDLASLLYTSGTTGHSKGVMLSHKNLVTNALSAYEKVSIKPDDVFLSILPLAHTLECTVGLTIPLLHGSSVYYIDKAPTPSVLLKAFEVVKPTMMLSVPLIIEKIYKGKILPKFTDSFAMRTLYSFAPLRKQLNKIAGKKLIETFGGRLRFFGIGGAALSPTVEEFLKEAKFPYIVGYGLTETAPLLAGSVLGDKIKLKSTGTAMAGVELAIKDKNPETGEGEIIAKSPSVMMGYYKDEVKTAEVMEDGWFLTGDLGYIDDDGFLFISGRSKNVIIGPSGKNIYPEQIEATINQNEVVLDSLVMDIEGKLIARVHLDYEKIDKMYQGVDRTSDEVQKKILELLEEMRLDVNNRVASYSKIVKFVEQIEPFIKTPTKKIKRYLYTN
ncbi:MAG: AMP-binding protein [Campylobacterales bacterium]|nr:AMP-binding protein [Campylobacterales bacterium]